MLSVYTGLASDAAQILFGVDTLDLALVAIGSRPRNDLVASAAAWFYFSKRFDIYR